MATSDQQHDAKHELRPFTEQEPFLGTDRKYYGYVSGVGAGKTFAGVLRTALNVEHWNPGEMGAIIAPTTTMIDDVIIPVMRNVGLFDHWEYRSAYSDESGIHAPNGARVLLLSANNRRRIERLAGLNLAWFWIDEAPRVQERAYEILTQRIRVGQYRNGFLTGTPKGKDYVYETFIGGVDGEHQEHGQAELYVADDRLSILRVPTHANPHTPDDYKTQVDKDHDGQVYEQEILGRFVDFEGLVYPWFQPETHVIDGLEANVRRVFYGVDWGHNNPAGIVAVGETTQEQLVVLGEFKHAGLDYNEMVEAAQGMQDEFREGRFYCDPSEPAAIDMFQKAGLDAMGAENDILPGIQYVSAQRDDFRVMDYCKDIRNELNEYHYDPDKAKEVPVSVNDHLLDALRYALFTDAKHGGRNHQMYGADRYL